MGKRIPINLDEVVPPIATFATITYGVPGTSKALLYSHENDKHPMEIVGPSGELEVRLTGGTTLYLEPLDDSRWTINCAGYRFDNGSV